MGVSNKKTSDRGGSNRGVSKHIHNSRSRRGWCIIPKGSRVKDVIKDFLKIQDGKSKPVLRVGNPKQGDRTLIVSQDVISKIATASYLVGNIEINGMGLIRREGDVIHWVDAWVISDIEELKEDYNSRLEKLEDDESEDDAESAKTKSDTKHDTKNDGKSSHIVTRTMGNWASPAGVHMDSAKVAQLLCKVVEAGGDPQNLCLYWHTHGVGSAYWSSTDLHAISKEVHTAGGNEVINVVMVPGKIKARIDQGIDEAEWQSESLAVKMEGNDDQRYHELGSIRQTITVVSTGVSGRSQYDRSWPPGEYDSILPYPDRGWSEDIEPAGIEPAGPGPEGLDDDTQWWERFESCICGSHDTTEVNIGDGRTETICQTCGRVVGGPMDGVQLF